MTSGCIFDIQRFSIHDGPGIRTTVFLKGCPLRCLWCHNPESQDGRTEVFYTAERCIGCGHCVQSCSRGCHRITNGTHVFDRQNCVACAQCADMCYADALKTAGYQSTVEAVITEVVKDEPFYLNSGGGMTISGGEPMLQFAFSKELLQSAKQHGLHTCIETSGWGALAHFVEIQPLVDLFLFDVKETDPDRHQQYTGVSNEPIVQNLLKLDELGASIILRCPIIPSLNDREEHFVAIANLAEQTKHVTEIHILPYHALGMSKNTRLGKSTALDEVRMPDDTQVQQWIDTVQHHTKIDVKRN